jgi:hypothetical protein
MREGEGGAYVVEAEGEQRVEYGEARADGGSGVGEGAEGHSGDHARAGENDGARDDAAADDESVEMGGSGGDGGQRDVRGGDGGAGVEQQESRAVCAAREGGEGGVGGARGVAHVQQPPILCGGVHCIAPRFAHGSHGAQHLRVAEQRHQSAPQLVRQLRRRP